MNDSADIKAQLSALAEWLASRRGQILDSWLRAVELDPELTTPSGISRAQFNDHIPQVLDAFGHRLLAEDEADKAQAQREQTHSAAEHGLHRWQQGYNQRETIREWGHLHYVLLNQLEEFGGAHPALHGTVMRVARRALVRLCGEGVAESAARYERLQRTEAAGRMRELESALEQLRDLDRQRAEVWREAAHDLRGTVGVITNASAILSREAETDPSRATISQILQRSVTSLRGLLTDLMDLARLEAGQEHRRIRRFDVAAVLREFCDSMRPLAAERGLFLKAEGPASLTVDGDSVKILRIAQNLVLNALKVTQRGGICVQWDERAAAGTQQWVLCVQDTGPGFQSQSAAAPLESALRHATAEAHELDAGAGPRPAATLKSQSDPHPFTLPAGEGIGLSIVKRLCELLDASLELETAPGAGSTFRVLLPRAYSDSERQEPPTISASVRPGAPPSSA